MRYWVSIGALIFICCSAAAWTPDANVTRGVYLHYRDLLPETAWHEWGDGYEIVTENPHSGDSCTKATGQPGGTGQGVSQGIEFEDPTAAPLKISGYSRAESVQAGEESWRYSIYVDLTYADGESWPMQLATFKPGTHGWQYSETVIEPQKPVASARYHAFIRGIGGTVWFDDLFFGPADGDNFLEAGGFEQGLSPDVTRRENIFDTYDQLHANAIHTYTRLPEDEDDANQLRTVLDAAKERGIGVVVTTHLGALPMEDADDPNFPQYNCVLGDWGKRWVQTMAGLAEFDFMGISLVPDEYNWNTGRFKRRLVKHSDQELAEFYKELPRYCNCPVCHRTYRKWYGEELPAMGSWSRPPKQTDGYRKWIDFRYRATTNWIRRSAEAINSVNPQVRCDSLICVSPICSDFRLGTGVTWDMVGYHTDIDFPTTDPYIILHNYKGDSTHWYVTETTSHLVGCTPKRQAGVVLESSRLRPQHRELDPVEIYGSALSAVSRGAKELAWFHYVHITGQSQASQGEESFNCTGGAYQLLENIDPWLSGARPLRRVAFLYSRASDEYFSFYTHPEPDLNVLTHDTEDKRYPFLAQKELLYYLFRSAIPTDFYYLDQVSAAELADYPVIVVPFPFAIGDRQRELLTELARSGKQVVIVSEFGAVDETGRARDVPALLDLCGLAEPPSGQIHGSLKFTDTSPVLTGKEFDGFDVYGEVKPAADAGVLATVEETPVIIEHSVGAGRVIFLAGEFGIDLPAGYDYQDDSRDVRVQPASLSEGHTAILDALLRELYGEHISLLHRQWQGRDLEIAAMRNDAGDVLVFAINWEDGPISLPVTVPGRCGPRGRGYRIDRTGEVNSFSVHTTTKDTGMIARLPLEGQQAVVVRFPRG